MVIGQDFQKGLVIVNPALLCNWPASGTGTGWIAPGAVLTWGSAAGMWPRQDADEAAIVAGARQSAEALLTEGFLSSAGGVPCLPGATTTGVQMDAAICSLNSMDVRIA